EAAHRGALPLDLRAQRARAARGRRASEPDPSRVQAHVRGLPRRAPGRPHRSGGVCGGWVGEGRGVGGSPLLSRRLEFYSKTLKDWKWPEHAVPTYGRSHVHWSAIDRAKGEMLLLPTFRLPTLIHSRSGNAKWLYEISHKNPLWLHSEDAGRLGVTTGDLLRVETEIGHFVDRKRGV